MRKLKLDSLQEGMVVAADVRNMDDMLLIPAGVELTSRHIRILQTWGVTELAVESNGQDEVDADPLLKLGPEKAAELQAGIEKRFWKFDSNNPAQKELFRLVLRRKAKQMLAS